MSSVQPHDPEPVRPFVTVLSIKLRLKCDCGRELRITALSPSVRCVCDKRWMLRITTTLARDKSSRDGERGRSTS